MLPALLVPMALQALPAVSVQRVPLAPLGQSELLALQAQLALRALPAQLVPMAQLVLPALLAL